MELTVGDAFDYPTVVAEDFEGNNLNVDRTGDEVDADTPGTYIVTFSAEDANGKTATFRLTGEVIEDYDRNDMSVAEAIAF